MLKYRKGGKRKNKNKAVIMWRSKEKEKRAAAIERLPAPPSPRPVRAFTRGCELLPLFIGGTVLLGLTGAPVS